MDSFPSSFGVDGATTPRLPIEANGDRELVDRLSKLPIDKQPFWLINWQALEANRNNPQNYPQRPSSFVDPNLNTGSTNTGAPSIVTTNAVTSGTNSGIIKSGTNSESSTSASTTTGSTTTSKATRTTSNTGTSDSVASQILNRSSIPKSNATTHLNSNTESDFQNRFVSDSESSDYVSSEDDISNSYHFSNLDHSKVVSGHTNSSYKANKPRTPTID